MASSGDAPDSVSSLGGIVAHVVGPKLSFLRYKQLVAICYLVHGGAYVVFSQMPTFGWALVFIGLSRAAVAVSSVLNMSILLRHVADEFRGRVFSTNESLIWATMMLSMLAAGIASMHVSPRTIGAWSGVLSSLTALYWIWADRVGLLRTGRSEPRGRRSRGAAGAAGLISTLLRAEHEDLQRVHGPGGAPVGHERERARKNAVRGEALAAVPCPLASCP